MAISIETKFAVGELVTFRTMDLLKETAGRPMVLTIVFVRADWGVSGIPSVRYYCRVIYSEVRWDSKNHQCFLHGTQLEDGCVLVEESELVPYVPEDPKKGEGKGD